MELSDMIRNTWIEGGRHAGTAINFPAGFVAEGDEILLLSMRQTSPFTTITAGWTQIHYDIGVANVTTWWRTATAADATNGWSVTVNQPNTNDDTIACIVFNTPGVVQNIVWGINSATAAPVSAPSVTSPGGTLLTLAMGRREDGGPIAIDRPDVTLLKSHSSFFGTGHLWAVGHPAGDTGPTVASRPTAAGLNISAIHMALNVGSTGPEVDPNISASLDFGLDVSGVPTTSVYQSIDLNMASSVELVASTDLNSRVLSFGMSFGSMVHAEPKGVRWRVVVTDRYGIPDTILENAVIENLRRTLNEPRACTISLPATDQKAASLYPWKFKEVQIYQGNSLRFAGPMVRPTLSKDRLQIQCYDPYWYLTKITLGRLSPINMIPNGDAEEGKAHWGENVAFYSNDQRKPGFTITSDSVSGSRAFEVSALTTGHDTCISTQFSWVVNGTTNPNGDLFSLHGYMKVLEFNGPALEERGAMLERFSSTEPNPDPVLAALGHKKSLGSAIEPINADTPRNEWLSYTRDLISPFKAGEPELIACRLYPPNGRARYDAQSVIQDARYAWYDQPQSTIWKDVIAAVQDPNMSKGNLNLGARTEAGDRIRTLVIPHSDHRFPADVLNDFVSEADGWDWHVEVTPTRRTAVMVPRLTGEYKPDLSMILTPSGSSQWIADFTWSFEGDSAANAVAAAGRGTGASREVGVAADDDAFLGGLRLEEVFYASHDTDLSRLGARAQAHLDVVRSPEVLEVTVPAGSRRFWLRALPGDWTTVRLSRGPFETHDIYRLVSLNEDPRSGGGTVTLNRRPPV